MDGKTRGCVANCYRKSELQAPTLPHECMLAIALPTTKEEFFEAYNGGAYHDFVTSIGEAPEYLWIDKYKDITNTLQEVAALAEQSGMTVLPRLRLCDLLEICSYKVITIFAHWRGHILRTQDIDIKALNKKISMSNDKISSLIKHNNILSASDPGGLLTALMESQCFFAFDESDEAIPVLDDIELHYRNREALDKWCGMCFCPGNRLELYDGLYPVGKIAQNIPQQFSGIIDFAACDSALLYRKIKNPNRRIIFTGNSLELYYRLILQKKIIQTLTTYSVNYALLINSLEKNLLKKHYSDEDPGIFTSLGRLFRRFKRER